jgi:hypothetical protein
VEFQRVSPTFKIDVAAFSPYILSHIAFSLGIPLLLDNVIAFAAVMALSQVALN